MTLRIWRAHGLRPHLVRQFKLSNDPQFAAKLKDIVGGQGARSLYEHSYQAYTDRTRGKKLFRLA